MPSTVVNGLIAQVTDLMKNVNKMQVHVEWLTKAFWTAIGVFFTFNTLFVIAVIQHIWK